MLLSVIVPCFNEELVLRATYERLTKVCRELRGLNYELVFVNDGSVDQTQKILSELQQDDPQFVSLGIIGEYLGRIYTEVKRRPLYAVQERLGFDHGRTPVFEQEVAREKAREVNAAV